MRLLAEESLERFGDEIRDKESELVEAKKHAQKAKKYEALYERDRKLQEFIDKFPETKKQEVTSKQKIQENIVALMKHISKGTYHCLPLCVAHRIVSCRHRYATEFAIRGTIRGYEGRVDFQRGKNAK